MKWYAYQVNNLSVSDWRMFGVKHERIVDNTDIHVLARALVVLEKCTFPCEHEGQPPVKWLEQSNEYWIAPCPGLLPIVCVRPNQNPYSSGYIVSPMELPHMSGHVCEVELG